MNSGKIGAGRDGWTGKSKVLQEVLADLKNEGFLALEPDEERGGNAVAKPAEEKDLAEAQAAEG